MKILARLYTQLQGLKPTCVCIFGFVDFYKIYTRAVFTVVNYTVSKKHPQHF